MKYTITLDKPVEIFDTKAIIINGEQGWTIAQLDDYHSDVIFVRKSSEVEMASELEVMCYAEALHNMSFGQISLLIAEAKDTSIIRSNGEWEMHRNGKLFRYDTNCHLFEEVTNNT